MPVTQTVELDVAVIGGGVAGLWLLNRLQQAGYQSAVFESKALGSDQTVASQGMIHGGIKYTLSGAFSGASEAIADMPAHWQACLLGKGDVDLRGAKVLSDHFYMWSSASVTSKLTTFFASKATRGRVDKVDKNNRPAIFQHADFKGQLYRLVDMVLDVPSVVATLAQQTKGQTYLLPASHQWRKDASGNVELLIEQADKSILVKAKRFIFSAGKGNGALLEHLGVSRPAMQIRPLHQVMVKHKHPHPFYGHCLGTDKTPRLTISSHPAADGQWVWYLGGSLAEKGVQQSEAEVIKAAQHELSQLMPWLDLSGAQWSGLRVERAEPRQKNLVRPDKAFVGKAEGIDNLLVAWPTKLTLTPNLANETLEQLSAAGITPSKKAADSSALELLAQAPVAATPWAKFDS